MHYNGGIASIIKIGEDHSPEVALPLTIVIPAYNEEKRISGVIRELVKFITENHSPWHIHVVIDGDDNTSGIVERFSKSFPYITYNISTERKGKGEAIKRGAAFIDTELMLILDADNSISIQDIARQLGLLETGDVIVFSRYSKGLGVMPIHRRILSRGFNALVRLLLDLDITDTQSGYKIFRTSYFKEAIKQVSVTGPFYDVSLLYHLKKHGAKLIEVPTLYKHGDGSKFNSIGLTIGMGVSLLAFIVRNSRLYSMTPEFLVRAYYRLFRWL